MTAAMIVVLCLGLPSGGAAGVIRLPGGQDSPVERLVYSPDGRRMAAVTRNLGESLVWDIPSRSRIPLDLEEEEWMDVAVFSADGGLLACRDGVEISLWDLEAAERRWTVDIDAPAGIAFAPGGAALAVADENRFVRLLSVTTGERMAEVTWGDPFRFIEDDANVAFSLDGTRVLASGVKEDRKTGERTWMVRSWDYPSLEGRGDGTEEVRCFYPGGRVAWPAEIADQRLGVAILRLRGDGRAHALSEDGRLVACAEEDGGVRIREVISGEEILRIRGHRDIRCLRFAPDGRSLASGGEDIHVWDLTGGAPVGIETWSEETWDLLAMAEGGDGARAFRAMISLASAGDRALPFLRDHILEEIDRGGDAARDLVKALDGPDFETREKAQEALRRLGEEATTVLREAVAASPSPEVRWRAETLLEEMEPRLMVERRPSDFLRYDRVIWVLERVGTYRAANLLDLLAGAAPYARVREAAAWGAARIRVDGMGRTR